MTKPKLLDLFCGAGGAAMGYYRAGFEVVGVDIKPQPHYPFEFHQADALEFPLEGFDAYHASPPCQGYMNALNMPNVQAKYKNTPLLIGPTRELLLATGNPFVLENVPGSPLLDFIVLSGMMFNLKVIRRRWFECHGFDVGLLPPPQTFKNARRAGYIPYNKGETSQRNRLPQIWNKNSVSKAMCIDWMNLKELNDAIPPAYTEYIGKYLLQAVTQ
ncbi:hypothetical protein KKE60_04825 [Patescibacteria group bacterium]|nr:hypothetical protein [Patescibacteria group bacterium]